MIVAHCIHGLGLGGAQQVIKYLVRATANGRLRHVVYSCDDGVFRQDIERAGARVRIIPRRLPKFDPLWAMGLARAMRADEVAVVHTHLFGDSLHGYVAARAAGAPVVMTLHIAADGLSGLQRGGYRWLLPRVARAVACSDAVARSWSAGMPVIANAIEAPRGGATRDAVRAALGLPADCLAIGAVGRLTHQKGFDCLIDALALLDTPGARLVLVGDGELRAELTARAAQRGVGERVSFAGFRGDMAALWPAFDVVAFPSRFEGLPMALLEAMAAQRCIVASDAPGIGDAVADDVEAMIVARGDAAALAAALRRALGDAALRARLAAAAQRRFRNAFTADRMIAQYEALYGEVLGFAAAPAALPLAAGASLAGGR